VFRKDLFAPQPYYKFTVYTQCRQSRCRNILSKMFGALLKMSLAWIYKHCIQIIGIKVNIKYCSLLTRKRVELKKVKPPVS